MAILYKCDRCGKIGGESSVREVTLKDRGTAGVYSICLACKDLLLEWLKPAPEEIPQGSSVNLGRVTEER